MRFQFRTLCVSLLLTLTCGSAAATVIDDAALNKVEDGSNWAAWGRTFDEQRFSPLDQINTQNVSKLGLAWSLDFDNIWNVSSQPVAVDGVIYTAVGYSHVYAIDALTGKVLWDYDPKVTGRKMGMAWGSRGIAFYKGKVLEGAQDGRLFALDAKTGKLLWEVQTTDPKDNRYITGAPRVFDGKVIIGHGGADFGFVRGYVTTYDVETGKELWRWYVVPGNPKDGFEDESQAAAAKTWTGEWWKNGGGGTVWNAMTYDPKMDRIYLGTGNGSPWNHKLRSPQGGDNLYLCSIVALDAKTGKYLWHYQTTPGESWDFNSTMDMVLANVQIDGKPRNVLMHAPKNGFFYVLDRDTGKLISAEKIGKVTWADHIDMKTGRPVETRGARYEDGEALMWPGSGGTHNWQPMAYSPDTGLVYIPAREMAGYYNDEGRTPKNWEMSLADPMGLNGFFDDIPKEAGSTSLLAWNPVTQKQAWRQPTPGATNGGVIVTHGGLVFQGRSDGRFVAVDAKDGKELWSYYMGVGTQAAPMTYTVNGKQYVTILAGWGGAPALLGSLSAQHGWVGRSHPRRMLTFVMDGKATLPPSPPPSPGKAKAIDDPNFKTTPELVEKGKHLFVKCVICHGVSAVAGGYAPDLRASPIPLNSAAFKMIVRDGALQPRGMPPFESFSDEDLLALQNYIRDRARYEPGVWDQIKSIFNYLRLLIKMELVKRGWID